MKKRRDSGLEGYRKGGFRTGGMQNRRDVGQEECRKGKMLYRWDAGQWTGVIQESRESG